MENLKQKLYDIIFEADTRAGKMFDILLLILISISVGLVMLESVPEIKNNYNELLKIGEWVITIIFTIEYFLRIYIVRRKFRFMISFYGLIDLLAIIPTYLSLIVPGSHGLIVIRVLRLLRIFRILNLTNYSVAGQHLARSIWASRRKIGVFFFFLILIVIVIGTLMYMIEGEKGGFTSIPQGIYWAIVTLTTVGYGDISPITPLGQLLASIVMILGYAVIAVPTGIVTAEIIHPKLSVNTQVCPNCFYNSHDDDAKFCKICGSEINETTNQNKT